MSLPLLSLEVRLESDVVLARQRARQIAGLVGFALLDQTRIATAVSEIARNAFQYAGGGTVEFKIESGSSPGLIILVRERGPGIQNLQAILDGRYDSPTGLGVGILGAKRLMDRLDIESSADGSKVTMVKKLAGRKEPFAPQDLARISVELTQRSPQGLLEELQVQNQELLRLLQELRDRQAEVAELHTRELQETNRGVVALYSELDENAIQLRRISELKSRFLSNMSHEFRSPLNTILSMSSFLLNGSSGDLTEEQNREIGFIKKAAQDLSALVNDLLDLAKVEAGKAVIRPENFEVADLFEGLRGMTKTLILQDSVKLVVETPLAIPPLQTDEGKLAQILRNFLSNSAKFTDHGEIRLAVSQGPGDTVIFTVTDTGIGIAMGDQRRIFEEFSQVEGPFQKRVKGTGLGLPLSRKLAELLGGDVSVRSQPGVGSKFFAMIPRRYQVPEEIDGRTGSRWELNSGLSPILVVDDDPVDLLIYQKLLEGTGFQVFPARNLGEARRILQRVRPDAVLLDLLVDGEGGWKFLAEMRGEAATKSIPILVLTLVEGEERALVLEATDFAEKPIDRTWLLDRLKVMEKDQPFETILLVDNHEADRYLLKESFSPPGRFSILEAMNGEEGFRLAVEEQPDVIILNLIMPDMTGLEFLDRLQSRIETKGIPVIFHTPANLTQDDWRRIAPGAVAIFSSSRGMEKDLGATIREALVRAGLKLSLEGAKD